MSLSVVTADLGNTHLKLRAWRLGGATPERVSALELVGDGAELASRAGPWLAEREATRAALCSVVAAGLAEQVAALLSSACEELCRSADAGLTLDVRAPERVGADRVHAARGALEHLGGSCLVVDAGTALTVDAVRAGETPDGTVGRFLGGAIAPGPELLAASLASGTAHLPRVEPRAGAPALGRDTEEAVAAGVVVGFRGAARALIEGVAREAGLAGAPCVVTGGARSLLLEPEPICADLVAVEDLVHLGLLAVLAGVPRP